MLYPENFYGFPDIPFHVHLGMTFSRRVDDGPPVVTLPALDRHAGADGRQSASAVYTLGEVACGVQACDDLLVHTLYEADTTVPLVLTRRIVFRPLAPAYGELRSRTRGADDAEAVRERLAKRRRLQLETRAVLVDEHGTVAGETHAEFYVRIMARERFEAMTGTLLSTLTGGAAA